MAFFCRGLRSRIAVLEGYGQRAEQLYDHGTGVVRRGTPDAEYNQQQRADSNTQAHQGLMYANRPTALVFLGNRDNPRIAGDPAQDQADTEHEVQQKNQCQMGCQVIPISAAIVSVALRIFVLTSPKLVSERALQIAQRHPVSRVSH